MLGAGERLRHLPHPPAATVASELAVTLAVTSKLNLAITYLADGRLDARLAIAGREASAAVGHAGGNGSASASGEEWQSGLFDKGSWVEAQAGWARTVITGGHRCFAFRICAPSALICLQRLCDGDWTKRAHAARFPSLLGVHRLVLSLGSHSSWPNASPCGSNQFPWPAGRARLGGTPVGVIAVESATVMLNVPADPGMPDSSERIIPQVLLARIIG